MIGKNVLRHLGDYRFCLGDSVIEAFQVHALIIRK
jgi:hypothetical protein